MEAAETATDRPTLMPHRVRVADTIKEVATHMRRAPIRMPNNLKVVGVVGTVDGHRGDMMIGGRMSSMVANNKADMVGSSKVYMVQLYKTLWQWDQKH